MDSPKLCFSCARRQLAHLTPRECRACLDLNLTPLEKRAQLSAAFKASPAEVVADLLDAARLRGLK
jgi:hypothetical protein